MGSKKTARLIDVARLAKVGKTTASDALSGTGRMSEETRKTVLDVAQQLSYVPNGAARHLRKSLTGTLAVILPEALNRSYYYMAFTFGVVAASAERNFDVAIVTPSPPGGRSRAIRADGIIVSDPQAKDPTVQDALGAGMAIVTCEHVPDVRGVTSGTIWSQHEAVMTELLIHLELSGSQRPAMLVAEETAEWPAALVNSYQRWCRAHNVELVMETVQYEATWAEMRMAAASLLTQHPEVDALICGPDGSAVEILPVLSSFGRVLGRDIMVASCVDSAPMQFASPPITSINVRARESGVACAELLIDVLTGEAEIQTEREHHIELITRESTRPLDGR